MPGFVRYTTVIAAAQALLFACTLSCAISAEERSPFDTLKSEDIGPTGPVVQLSELQVDGRVKLKRLEDDWLSARVGQLEILSNADPALTRESIEKLQQLDHALTLIFPQLRSRPRQPLTIVLCGDRRRFESFRHLGPPPPKVRSPASSSMTPTALSSSWTSPIIRPTASAASTGSTRTIC